VKIADLSRRAFADRLAGDGLPIQFGPFVCHLTLRIPEAVAPLHELYASFPIADDDEPIDAYITGLVARSGRAPWKRLARLYIDGEFHAVVNDPAIAVPSLEWTMNWAIGTRANQYLLLHAGALEANGGALLLPAPPGSGKSTLTAGLASRGWRLLSDEFAVLREDTLEIRPCPRPISLKKGAIEAMRAYSPKMVLSTVFPGTFKGTIGYAIPPPASVEAQHVPSQPKAIVFPKWRQGAGVEITPLTPLQAYLRLILNAVNYELIGEPAVATVNELVQRCPACLFEYSDLDEAGKILAERLG
jgi:HprK-related kinase A